MYLDHKIIKTLFTCCYVGDWMQSNSHMFFGFTDYQTNWLVTLALEYKAFHDQLYSRFSWKINTNYMYCCITPGDMLPRFTSYFNLLWVKFRCTAILSLLLTVILYHPPSVQMNIIYQCVITDILYTCIFNHIEAAITLEKKN